MKSTKLLITLYVFLASFLFVGMALANDSGIFDSVNSNSNLAAPNLTVEITGNEVLLSWNEVAGASYYQVHYAQKPYDNPDTIKTINAGNKTNASYDLSPGSAYHVAVKACDASGINCSDYANIHDVKIPLVSTFKNSLGQVFKLIPAGTFTMGSPSDELGRIDCEGPQHQVRLTRPYYMQTTEVTQAQWEAVMESNPSRFSGCPTCPVEQVSWNDAQSYIAKMNLRSEGTYSLPTEAQWEYAARAGSTTAFYNGAATYQTPSERCDTNLDSIGWYICNWEGVYTRPVGLKSPNAWGLYGMAGNVEEWVYDKPSDYTSEPQTDPVGFIGESAYPYRVYRGGCSATLARWCRSAFRSWYFESYREEQIGFRLAREQ